jgi:Domain of unknown function (DUF4129)
MRWQDRLGSLVAPALAGTVEGAWVAVFYAAWQIGLGHRAPVLGPLTLAVAAWAGLWWIRSGLERDIEVVGLAGLVVAGAALGVLSDPTALGAFLSGDPGVALARHSAGLLAGVAVLRGARHRDPALDDVVVGNLLTWGLPSLALPWILGTLLEAPWRVEFISLAFPATLLLVTAGLLAVGLARLDALAAEVGIDGGRRSRWIGVAVGVLGLMALIAVPAALVLGAPLGSVVDGLFGPLASLAGLALLPFFVLAVPLLTALELVPLHQLQPGPSSSRTSPVGPLGSASAGDPIIVIAVIVLAAAALLIAAALVAGWGPRRRRRIRAGAGEATLVEERTPALPPAGFGLPHWRIELPRRPGPPRDASGAYLAWLRDLGARPEVARRAAESPAAHARRVRREAGMPGAAGLLAADFELERYGGRTLGGLETRRALARWRRLRRWTGRI